VLSFTPRPLYPQGKSPRYPLYKRLDGPEGRSLTLQGLEFRSLGRPARSQSLYRLRYKYYTRQQALPSKSFPIQHSCTMPPLDAAQYSRVAHDHDDDSDVSPHVSTRAPAIVFRESDVSRCWRSLNLAQSRSFLLLPVDS
jgi:hypothetical protein